MRTRPHFQADAAACERCNRLKGQLLENEFRELLALLHPAARSDLERRLLAGGQRYAGPRTGEGATFLKKAVAAYRAGPTALGRFALAERAAGRLE